MNLENISYFSSLNLTVEKSMYFQATMEHFVPFTSLSTCEDAARALRTSLLMALSLPHCTNTCEALHLQSSCFRMYSVKSEVLQPPDTFLYHLTSLLLLKGVLLWPTHIPLSAVINRFASPYQVLGQWKVQQKHRTRCREAVKHNKRDMPKPYP